MSKTAPILAKYTHDPYVLNISFSKQQSVGEYQKAGVMGSLATAGSNHTFSIEEDF
jgi:hypothetical protein